jgi:hypothetical protein
MNKLALIVRMYERWDIRSLIWASQDIRGDEHMTHEFDNVGIQHAAHIPRSSCVLLAARIFRSLEGLRPIKASPVQTLMGASLVADSHLAPSEGYSHCFQFSILRRAGWSSMYYMLSAITCFLKFYVQRDTSVAQRTTCNSVSERSNGHFDVYKLRSYGLNHFLLRTLG